MNELPDRAIGVLSQFASTQVQCDVFSDQVIESVKNGEENPLKVLVQLKAFEKCSDRIQKEIKDNYMIEAGKYPGDSFEFMGNQVQKAENGVKYDYASTGDPVYLQRLKVFQEAEKQLKEREQFLKAVKTPFSLLDEGTGEVSIISPPMRTSSSGLKITIK